MNRAAATLMALLAVVHAPGTVRAQDTFALVVGVNRAARPGQAPLRYADDDAVLFHRLMSTLGSSQLLTDLDEDSRRLHGQQAGTLRPTRKNLLDALDRVLSLVAASRRQGNRPTLYFMYSGHGDVKNNEGYITLADGVFSARDLEVRLLRRSRAVSNHVIIDACKSYFMVHTKRAGGTRRPVGRSFYRARSLARAYPDTGFLLSTSSGQSSHEWEKFQAGVFSHEVRSGLIGAADVDGDGRVTYNEIWAFIHVANREIPNARFRPTVYMEPPRGDGSQVLLINREREKTRPLPIKPPVGGRFVLEDQDGIRLADLNAGASMITTLWLPVGRRLYLHDLVHAQEYLVPAQGRPSSLGALQRRPSSHLDKGAALEAFGRIFSRSFDQESYGEAVQALSQLSHQVGDEPGIQLAQEGEEGAGQDPGAGLLALTYELRNGYLEQAGLLHGVSLFYSHAVGPLRLGASVGYAGNSYQRDDGISATFHEVTIAPSVGVRHGLLSWLQLQARGDLGFAWGVQDGEVPGGEQVIASRPLFRFQAVAGLDFRVAGPLLLSVGGQVGGVVLPGANGTEVALTGGGQLGFGVQL